MVIGNGMMANAFKEFEKDNSVIVFASGVSNSKETDMTEYQKEFSLLSNLRGTKATLIYFSSCSIYDNLLKDSLYVNHKKQIEKFIELNFSNYLIFRLPNVIGSSSNVNTMVNFFYNSIINNQPFELQKNAFRYFIDVEDVKITIKKAIELKELKSGSYNLLFPFSYRVDRVVNLLENFLNKKGNYIINNIEGKGYDVNLSAELLPFVNFDKQEPGQYLKDVIVKYYTHKIQSL